MLQRRKQISRSRYQVASGAEALSELDKVRVAKVNMRVVSQLQVHLPLDHSIGPVHPDQCSKRYLLSHSSLELHRVHQETSVSRNREDLTSRKSELRSNRPWQSEGHR